MGVVLDDEVLHELVVLGDVRERREEVAVAQRALHDAQRTTHAAYDTGHAEYDTRHAAYDTRHAAYDTTYNSRALHTV